jgi:hypothetical protein
MAQRNRSHDIVYDKNQEPIGYEKGVNYDQNGNVKGYKKAKDIKGT